MQLHLNEEFIPSHAKVLERFENSERRTNTTPQWSHTDQHCEVDNDLDQAPDDPFVL